MIVTVSVYSRNPAILPLRSLNACTQSLHPLASDSSGFAARRLPPHGMAAPGPAFVAEIGAISGGDNARIVLPKAVERILRI
jgi:hypothetical protein